jgi:glycosyltransferase involved in cell wall biosynthesis
MKIVIIADGSYRNNNVVFGSWIESLKSAQINDGNTYYYLFTRHFLEKKVFFRVNNIIYISYIRIRKNPTFIDLSFSFELVSLLKKIKADVIHIYGTEFSHTWKAYLATGILGLHNKTVLSLQAVLNDLYKNYLKGIPLKYIIFPSFKDILKFNSLLKEFFAFKFKAFLEILYLKHFKYIAGRTDFDFSFFSKYSSKKSVYLKAYESLRSNFFAKEKINKNDFEIFLSGSDSPRKGLHLVLKKLTRLIEIFPSIKLKIIGKKPYSGLKAFFFNDSYQNYIRFLLNKNKLDKYTFFLGYLNEFQFQRELVTTSLFIMPSTHENSPNSILEALIMDVPVIAYNVGGIKQILSFGGGIVCKNDNDFLEKIISFFDKTLIIPSNRRNPFIIDPKMNSKRYNKMYKLIFNEYKKN